MECYNDDEGYHACANEHMHPGYTHAESWSDTARVLKEGGEVFDRDGDQVVSVGKPGRIPGLHGDDDGPGYYTYTNGGGPADNTVESPFFLLVPIQEPFEPVTEEEIAEVVASLVAAQQRKN